MRLCMEIERRTDGGWAALGALASYVLYSAVNELWLGVSDDCYWAVACLCMLVWLAALMICDVVEHVKEAGYVAVQEATEARVRFRTSAQGRDGAVHQTAGQVPPDTDDRVSLCSLQQDIVDRPGDAGERSPQVDGIL